MTDENPTHGNIPDSWIEAALRGYNAPGFESVVRRQVATIIAAALHQAEKEGYRLVREEAIQCPTCWATGHMRPMLIDS